jgi:hypothetical protein
VDTVKRTSKNLVGCLLLSTAASACGGNTARETSGDSAGPGSASSSSSASGATGASGSGAGGGASGPGAGGAGGGGGTREPGPPGCGFASPAFCETFDAPAGVPTRAGELDPARWSAARMCDIAEPSDDGEAVAIGPATVPTCRSGLPEQVFPSQDALICDGIDAVHSNHLLVLVAAQNYGQSSYRIRQPFDFAGRTGTIVFDADGGNAGRAGWLFGWISLEVTEDPAPAPSFTLAQNWENGAVPRNGIEVQLDINCGGDQIGVGKILAYDDHQQLEVFSTTSDCPLDAVQGKLNHFEVRLSTDHIAVYGTQPSDDGMVFGDLVLLAEADIALPFTRGYVHMTTHNHATMLYSRGAVDAWASRWDNVGFDGPVIGGWREYEALDSLSKPSPGRVDVGWRLADASTGPFQTIEIHDVDPSGVVSARLALENWSLHYPGEPPTPDFALNYRLNGHAWKARKLTAGELQMMIDLPNAGTRSMMLDVDVADLAAGTNILELTTTNAPISFYPPVVLNVDLVLATQ